MPLKSLDAPCWRLTDKTGADYDEGEGAQHHDTEKDAAVQAEAVADRHYPKPGPMLTPKPYTDRCVLIVCDGCGADPEDDAWATIHFPDMETARSMVTVYDYRPVADPAGLKVFCPDCPATDEDEDD